MGFHQGRTHVWFQTLTCVSLPERLGDVPYDDAGQYRLVVRDGRLAVLDQNGEVVPDAVIGEPDVVDVNL